MWDCQTRQEWYDTVFRMKNLKLKLGDIRVRTRGELTALIWKDKRDMRMLTDMHNPRAEGDFCGNSGNALKPAMVEN